MHGMFTYSRQQAIILHQRPFTPLYTPNVTKPTTPLPRKRHFTIVRAAAEVTDLQQLNEALSTGSLKKSALAKLKAAELKQLCLLRGVSDDGTKPVLVERLLESSSAATVESSPQQNGTSSAPPLQQQNSAPTSGTSGSMTLSQQRREMFQTLIVDQPPTTTTSSSSTTSGGNKQKPQNASDQTSSREQSSSPPPHRGAWRDVHDLPPNTAKVSVTWLGTSSGSPTSRRNVSSVAVRFDDATFLVDCGEGTVNQLREGGIPIAPVSHIFVTHLHGDHCFGIAGAIGAICRARLGTEKQNEPIRVYGPPELQRALLAACKAAHLQLTTPVILQGLVLDPARATPPKAVDPAGMLQLGYLGPDQAESISPAKARALQEAFDGGSDQVVQRGLTWTIPEILPFGVRVAAAQLQHRMPCWGYVFREPHVVDENGAGGKNGEKKVRPGRKLVILGDTMDSTAIADLAVGCDVISHEATFNKAMEQKALIASHSTAEQAGAFAGAINARNLVLTHFSARYEQLDKLSKVWATAKAQGVSVADLNAKVAASLADEARAACGSTRVYLANDYYTFYVPVRDLLTLEELKEEESRKPGTTAPPPQRRYNTNNGGSNRGDYGGNGEYGGGNGAAGNRGYNNNRGRGGYNSSERRGGGGGYTKRRSNDGEQQQYQRAQGGEFNRSGREQQQRRVPPQ